MITSKLIDGYSAIDGCYKYTDSDSTIDCYVFSRQALMNPIKTTDWELNTNSIYILVGRENNITKAYVGQAAKGNDGQSVFRRMKQHLGKPSEIYYPYWTQAIIFVCKNTKPNDKWKTSDLDDLEAILIKDTKTGYSWNNRNESFKNDISYEKIRSHSRKLFDIKEYIKELGFSFLDKSDDQDVSSNTTYEEKLAAQEKEVIDKTVSLEIINLEPTAKVPEYTTSDTVVTKMLKLLPWKTFDHTTTFFDPACKGGEFLALIHDKLSVILQNDPYFSKYTGIEKDMRIHSHIINHQLFGIAIGDNSYRISEERVYECKHIVKASDNYLNNLKNLNSTAALKKFKKEDLAKATRISISKEFGEQNMKFDIVIGNPPYQETTGGGNNGGTAIYDRFINASLNLSDKVCMIVKNNWLYSDSLRSLRENILNSGIKALINYSLLSDIFPNVGIAASIVYMDKNYVGEMEYTEIQKGIVQNNYCKDIKDLAYIPSSETEYNIVRKIKNNSKESFAYHVVGLSPFGINTNGALSTDTYIDESVIQTEYYDILLRYVDSTTYTNADCFSKNKELVDKYKIICPKQIHKTNNPIPSVIGLKPNQICSASFSLMYYDDDMNKAINVAKYIKTKFFRFLTNCLADTLCGLNAYRVSLVPDQNFTSSSDIDWSKPLADIDTQLYNKYNLTNEEIDYVDKSIKPMDDSYTAPRLQITPQDAEAALVNKLLQAN